MPYADFTSFVVMVLLSTVFDSEAHFVRIAELCLKGAGNWRGTCIDISQISHVFGAVTKRDFVNAS